MSWTVLITAALKESLRIAVHLYGISGARSIFLDQDFNGYIHENISPIAFLHISVPLAPAEHIDIAEKSMFKISAIMVEEGSAPNQVAKAPMYFAIIVEAKVVDKIYASAILTATFDELDKIGAGNKGT